jgi:hypothetical protein
MPNYYEVLKVSPKASRSEIKSAYRRLARKLHPDRNNGSEETALKFAAIAEAYEVLGSTKERAKYDQTILNAQFSTNGDSVFTSENPHARRWRRMVYEKRYNDIIDRMIAEERRETMAFQRAVYPAVSLLFTAFLAAALKPKIFITTGVLGKIVIISLFVAGLIHLGKRLRDAFVKYTDDDAAIHESILDGEERPPRQVRYDGRNSAGDVFHFFRTRVFPLPADSYASGRCASLIRFPRRRIAPAAFDSRNASK